MGEVIGISIAVAGLIITVVGSLIGLGYNQGVQSSRTKQNTKDIEDLKKSEEDIKDSFLVGQKELSLKLDLILKSQSDLCERVAKMEGRINGGH